jgi:D-alanyl-D-alanine endopeptidase (penicillin-binding protein 7)
MRLSSGVISGGLMALCVSIALTMPAFAGSAKQAGAAKRPAVAANPPAEARAKARPRVSKRSGKRVAVKRRVSAAGAPAQPSVGQLAGLHRVADELDLKSGVALVIDQDTDEVLFSKNPAAVLPIASLTKLMTALVVADAGMPLDEILVVGQDDVDTEKNSRSRLRVGAQLTRGEMLHLALMSSENRAAHALGRHYPGGMAAFVRAMNSKARTLHMDATEYVEPTGLSSRNRSSARDLVKLVKAASEHEIIREMSTSTGHRVEVGSRQLQFVNTNRLIDNPEWDIGLQKTGYIREAGRCLVMQASLLGRQVIMVFLDSAGKFSRLGDAERVRDWLTETLPSTGSRPLLEAAQNS